MILNYCLTRLSAGRRGASPRTRSVEFVSSIGLNGSSAARGAPCDARLRVGARVHSNLITFTNKERQILCSLDFGIPVIIILII